MVHGELSAESSNGRTGEAEVESNAEPWIHKWASPPPDIAIPISPPTGRERASRELSGHIHDELYRGRSLYRIVHDPYVLARIGGCDGRALPGHCLEGPGS